MRKKLMCFFSLITAAAMFGSGVQAAEGLETLAGQGGRLFADGTYAETRFTEPTGLAVSPSGGALMVADTGNNVIRMLSGGRSGTFSGALSSRDAYGLMIGQLKNGDRKLARFNRPTSLAYNSKGDLLISDSGNHAVRRIRDGKVTTFVGSGKAGYREGASPLFYSPGEIAVDQNDNIFLCDTMNHVVRKITPDGVSSLLAGVPNKPGFRDGDAEQALFHEPTGIAVDEDGTVYIADTGNQRIRVLRDGVISTLAGGGFNQMESFGYVQGGYADGRGAAARFNFPLGLCLAPDGRLLVADSVNHRIRVIDQLGNTATIAGNGNAGFVDGKPMSSELNHPSAVCVSGGTLYIADSGNSAVRMMAYIG